MTTEARDSAATASEHLEWPRLREALLQQCLSPATQRRGVGLASDVERARTALAETAEAMALLETEHAPPLEGLRDLDVAIKRASREGALDAPALADVRATLGAAAALRRFLAEHRELTPRLRESCHIDPSLDALDEQIGDAIEPDGTMRDDASAEFSRLRREVGNLRERIVGKLESLIEKHRDILSDGYYTLREGRYVVPVRRDAHERFHGIVHGTSASGASVFVEPRGVVEQGNRLKMATAEMEREAQRILAELSALVAEALPSVKAATTALEHMDLCVAKARLGRQLEGSEPELTTDGCVALGQARHPLLALDGVAVVPNDIELSAGRGLVISGPNAGGKTVLLRTVGLCALMARAGIPIPAAAGSRIAFFDPVLTDLGDEQSTQNNLSTFSAHITNLRRILDEAAPGALVLLDELASGTDPEEGAALACGLLDALCERGAAVAITTHYEPVKAFSLRDERLRAASVGLDLEEMTPTFELAMDVPGMSSALSVARRFGIPESVIDFARGVLPRQARDFEQLVRQLGERAAELSQERAELERQRVALEQKNAEQAQRLEQLRERGRKKLLAETEGLVAEVRDARARLDGARAMLKDRKLDDDGVRVAQAAIDEVGSRVALNGDLAPAPEPLAGPADTAAEGVAPDVAVGARVFVPRLRSEATIVDGQRGGQVRVAAGALKLWVDIAEVRAVASEQPTGAKPPAGASAPSSSGPGGPSGRTGRTGRSTDNTVDIKGMRVDDALSMVESFVDRMLTAPDAEGYIVHGHGTGALRAAVREHLSGALSHVTRVRPGTRDEGGDAVTVFTVE